MLNSTKLQYSVTRNPNPDYQNFELLDVNIKFKSDCLRLATVYRPPTIGNKSTASNFLTEFSTYLETILTTNNHLYICGDFNIHVDNPKCLTARNFNDIISNTGLHQHVTGQTHSSGHTLDLLISRTEDKILLSDLSVCPISFSDHQLIKANLKMRIPATSQSTISFRHLRKINIPDLCEDIERSEINKLSQKRNAKLLLMSYCCLLSRTGQTK